MLATTRTALDPLGVRLVRRPVVEENRSAQALPQAPHGAKDIATAGAPQRNQFPYYLIFAHVGIFSDDFILPLSVAQIPILEAHGFAFPPCGGFPVPLGSLDEQLVFLIWLTAPERSVHACYTATK